jgi:hypothetical protein
MGTVRAQRNHQLETLENDNWLVCSVLAKRSWEHDDCILASNSTIDSKSISKRVKNTDRLSSRKLGMCQKRESLLTC